MKEVIQVSFWKNIWNNLDKKTLGVIILKVFLYTFSQKALKYKNLNKMTNVIGKALEILRDFMERVQDCLGKVP